jgi:uncharacterized protein
MLAIVAEPWFYLAAVPAILFTGIVKGGFGTGAGILAVPLMALTVPPLQAAAIMLPILCLMDLVGLWSYRRQWDGRSMMLLLPGALIGIAIGALTAGVIGPDEIRLAVGLIAVVFALDYWSGRQKGREAASHNWTKGAGWGIVSGFTSFLAHAGGPPLAVYLLPLRLDKTIFVGTTVVYFTVVNYVKIVPYAWLGQFSAENLATALVLSPLAPAGVLAGIWLHKRVDPVNFYRISYILVFVIGAKLVWDGALAFLTP